MRQIQPPPLNTPHTDAAVRQIPNGVPVFSRPWSDWFVKVVTPRLQASFQFQSGTHSARTASKADNVPAGSLFRETDRTVFYVATGSQSWTYAFGTMFGLAANKPADLAANDAGFQFYATDTPKFWMWTGSAWVAA